VAENVYGLYCETSAMNHNAVDTIVVSLSQSPRGLRRRSAASCLQGLRVRILPVHGCLFVVSVVCRGLCDELITRPEEPYRMWCVVVCDLETS
jgi:hypothetical protein